MNILRTRQILGNDESRLDVCQELDLDPTDVYHVAIGTFNWVLTHYESTVENPETARRAAIADVFLAGLLVGSGRR